MNSFAQLPLFTISASIRPFFSTRPDKPRLINLVAEDNAIEDAIYHLHRALNSGRVDLERFLRVRYRCHLYFHLLTFLFTDHAGPCRRTVYEKSFNWEDQGWVADGDSDGI